MNSKRLNYGFIGLLFLLFVGFVISIQGSNTMLNNQGAALTDIKAKQQAVSNSQSQLTQDKKDVATYAELNTIAKSVVPQDKDQAEAVREIVNLAAQSGIPQLSSITFPPSTLGGTHSVGSLSQVTAVKGVPGVYQLQITVTQDNTVLVPYSNFITFLTKLEQNRRTAQVSSISINPDQKRPDMVSFTLVINEFIRP